MSMKLNPITGRLDMVRSDASIATQFLKLDASNDPITGTLTLTPASGNALQINAAASGKGLIIKANDTTPGNLTEWQNSSGIVLSTVDSNGNFGIGTSVPLSKLHIQESQIIINDASLFSTAKFNSQGSAWSSNSTLQALILQGGSTDNPEISWYRGTRTYPEASIRRHITADSGLQFWTGAGTSTPSLTMTLKSDQSVIVGSDTGNGAFILNGAVASEKTIIYQTGGLSRWVLRNSGTESGSNSGSNFFIQSRADDGTSLNANTMVFIRATSDVGIGTNGPGAKLQIDASASGKGLIVKANATTPGNLFELQSSAGTILGVANGSGDWGIGATAPLAGFKFYVNGKSRFSSSDATASTNSVNAYTFSGTSGNPVAYGANIFNTAASNSTATVEGGSFITNHQSASTLSTMVSMRGRVQIASGGTGAVTNATSILADTNDTDNGTITNSYLFRATNNFNTTTITNQYGLYIDNINVATNNYAIVTNAGRIKLGASPELPYTSKTTDYTVTADDYTINCTSGTFTITLPTAAGITGRVYVIKNSGVGTITVDGDASETIDGLTTQTIPSLSAMMIQSTGSGWIII